MKPSVKRYSPGFVQAATLVTLGILTSLAILGLAAANYLSQETTDPRISAEDPYGNCGATDYLEYACAGWDDCRQCLGDRWRNITGTTEKRNQCPDNCDGDYPLKTCAGGVAPGEAACSEFEACVVCDGETGRFEPANRDECEGLPCYLEPTATPIPTNTPIPSRTPTPLPSVSPTPTCRKECRAEGNSPSECNILCAPTATPTQPTSCTPGYSCQGEDYSRHCLSNGTWASPEFCTNSCIESTGRCSTWTPPTTTPTPTTYVPAPTPTPNPATCSGNGDQCALSSIHDPSTCCSGYYCNVEFFGNICRPNPTPTPQPTNTPRPSPTLTCLPNGRSCNSAGDCCSNYCYDMGFGFLHECRTAPTSTPIPTPYPTVSENFSDYDSWLRGCRIHRNGLPQFCLSNYYYECRNGIAYRNSCKLEDGCSCEDGGTPDEVSPVPNTPTTIPTQAPTDAPRLAPNWGDWHSDCNDDGQVSPKSLCYTKYTYYTCNKKGRAGSPYGSPEQYGCYESLNLSCSCTPGDTPVFTQANEQQSQNFNLTNQYVTINNNLQNATATVNQDPQIVNDYAQIVGCQENPFDPDASYSFDIYPRLTTAQSCETGFIADCGIIYQDALLSQSLSDEVREYCKEVLGAQESSYIPSSTLVSQAYALETTLLDTETPNNIYSKLLTVKVNEDTEDAVLAKVGQPKDRLTQDDKVVLVYESNTPIRSNLVHITDGIVNFIQLVPTDITAINLVDIIYEYGIPEEKVYTVHGNNTVAYIFPYQGITFHFKTNPEEIIKFQIYSPMDQQEFEQSIGIHYSKEPIQINPDEVIDLKINIEKTNQRNKYITIFAIITTIALIPVIGLTFFRKKTQKLIEHAINKKRS